MSTTGGLRSFELPTRLKLRLRVDRSFNGQIEAAVGQLKTQFTWFRSLDDEKTRELVRRLLATCIERLPAGHRELNVEFMDVELELDELQGLCEQILPLADARQRILDKLDLQHVFGDRDEEARLATCAERFVGRYERSDAIAQLDQDGKRFVLDLPALIGKDCRELWVTAVGSHGTIGAQASSGRSGMSLRHNQSASQAQLLVGAQLQKWHEGLKAKATCAFLLGDHFEPSALQKTDGPWIKKLFEGSFHAIYNGGIATRDVSRVLDGVGKTYDPTAHHRGIPYLAALGNEDYGLTPRAAAGELVRNAGRVMAQVKHTYESELGWNLPYRYYCATSPIADFFVIDSATFLFDKRQQDWLKTTYAARAGANRWRFLMSHHGLVTYARRQGELPSKVTRGKDPMRAAARVIQGEVNQHILTWVIGKDLHFHVNVAAQDRFSAAALLTYDGADGRLRRTYYVLAGGGGGKLEEGDLDTLVRLGPNLTNVELMEAHHGFAAFQITPAMVKLNFRLQRGSTFENVWETARELVLDKPGHWVADGGEQLRSKHHVNPILRNVFYKRGEGGLLHSSAYQRRYFEHRYNDRTFKYGERPGKLDHSIDLSNLDPGSRSWLKAGRVPRVDVHGAVGLCELTFRTRHPSRTWTFAVPEDLYPDLTAWLDSLTAEEEVEPAQLDLQDPTLQHALITTPPGTMLDLPRLLQARTTGQLGVLARAAMGKTEDLQGYSSIELVKWLLAEGHIVNAEHDRAPIVGEIPLKEGAGAMTARLFTLEYQNVLKYVVKESGIRFFFDERKEQDLDDVRDPGFRGNGYGDIDFRDLTAVAHLVRGRSKFTGPIVEGRRVQVRLCLHTDMIRYRWPYIRPVEFDHRLIVFQAAQGVQLSHFLDDLHLDEAEAAEEALRATGAAIGALHRTFSLGREDPTKDDVGLLTCVHGDCYGPNIFWDPATYTVSFIDLGTMAQAARNGGVNMLTDVRRMLGADTGKLDGKDTALQNFPGRREAFLEGYLLAFPDLVKYDAELILDTLERYPDDDTGIRKQLVVSAATPLP